jgi:hypothetical protein
MRKLEGYAAKFHARSAPIGGSFYETITPGAFADSLRTADVKFLWNHSTDHVLGRTSAGNLKLSEDAVGLKFSLDLPDTNAAKDLWELVSKRIVSQMSFGFHVPANGDTWQRAGADGLPTRVLNTISIHEISSTAFPAYPQTEVHVRAVVAAAQPTVTVPPVTSQRFEVKRRKLRLLELVA